MHLRDFVNSQKYVSILEIVDDKRSSDEDLDKFIELEQTIKNKKINSYQSYPIGLKNYRPQNIDKEVLILIKKEGVIYAYGSIIFHRVLLKKRITRVAYLNDLYFNDIDISFARRIWRNFFMELIKNKEEIEDFKSCKTVYCLLSEDVEENTRVTDCYKYQCELEVPATYNVHNIFSKHSGQVNKYTNYKVRKATLNDKEEILNFYISQYREKNFSDSPILALELLEEHIQLEKCIIVKENERIILATICEIHTMQRDFFLQMNNTYKLADSIVSLFKSISKSSGIFINTVNLTSFESEASLLPKDKIEAMKSIISYIATDPDLRDCLFINVTSVNDKALDRACESFLSLSRKMNMLCFSVDNIFNLQRDAV